MRGRVAFGAAVAAAFVLVLGAWRVRELATEAPVGSGEVEFAVPPGESFHDIARRLETEGLVVSAWRVRALARVIGADRSIHAGTYLLRRGQPPLSILDELVAGRVLQRRVTVPEGMRAEQIAEVVEDALAVPAAEFLAVVGDSARAARMGARSGTLEGYLFPDTYRFPDGVTAAEVVDAMLARFEDVWRGLPGARPDGYDRHDLVTLASIVEAETPLGPEKPRVAAVYWNRLDAGWKLQADPTVRYGLGYWAPRVYYKQLGIDTPYNTYMREGLPPGPIGSPGEEALAAVLAPLTPCEDFYFVASGNGGHVFSRTKAEHDRAVRAARAAAAAAQAKADAAAAGTTGTTGTTGGDAAAGAHRDAASPAG